MGYRLFKSIEINATAETVWRVITDFPGYKRWSDFKGELSGTASPGALIKVTARPRPGKLKITFFRITECDPPRSLRWSALYAPFWGLTGSRFFSIEELGPRTVRLTMGEEYRGWLLPLFKKTLDERGSTGFNRCSSALKTLCEKCEGVV